jgi:N-acetylglucosamine kinase-like BadF-type ATPase
VNALTVVNDLVPLACLYPDQDVVICAAGTGTGYVARSRDGQWARASGFEFIMSDEGGGFWIGQQVLSSIVRAHDGRGPKTILSKIVGDRLSLDPDRYLPSLFEWLHADQRQLKFQTASLADAVFEAFDCEDEVARIIIDRIVHELAIGVEAVRRAVGSEMQKARLLLTGSLLACNDYLVDALTTRLTALKATTKLYPTGRTDYLIDWIENWPRICESDRMPPALPIYVRHVPGEFE